MGTSGRIITIGLSPAWDIRCQGRDLDWNRHVDLDEQVVRPAGKALNVSYALAWLGKHSIAAGLWGREDHGQMRRIVQRLGSSIQTEMTLADGRTRRNITVLDTLRGQEMHLRDRSDLASERSLRRLNARLQKLTREGDLCVFSGAMPGHALLDAVVDLVRTCHRAGAHVVLDTSGPALKAIVEAGLARLVAPNVQELRELLGSEVPDSPAELVAAARTLLDKAEMVLLSRGHNGALFATRDAAWTARSRSRQRVLSTVGCGDYLLAGFLASLVEKQDPALALRTAVKVAAAHAWGWTETKSWADVAKTIPADVQDHTKH